MDKLVVKLQTSYAFVLIRSPIVPISPPPDPYSAANKRKQLLDRPDLGIAFGFRAARSCPEYAWP